LQGLVDVLDNGGQHLAGVSLRNARVLGDGGDQFSLSGHEGRFPMVVARKEAPSEDRGINDGFCRLGKPASARRPGGLGIYPAPEALWKLSTRLPATSRHPSTSTKKISLKGRLTTTGGSIIIPIDISTLATTRSLTRNGTTRRNPMVKAVFSSLLMTAGVTTLRGRSCAFAVAVTPDSRVNSDRSSGFTWDSMKVFTGSDAASKA